MTVQDLELIVGDVEDAESNIISMAIEKPVLCELISFLGNSTRKSCSSKCNKLSYKKKLSLLITLIIIKMFK